MAFKNGSYYQVAGRAAVYCTAGEVDNISQLPRVKIADRPIKTGDGFKWPACKIDPMSRCRESTAVARQTVGRRAAPNEKGFVYQAGYNKVLGYYSAGFRAFRFSGSSYNRKFQKDYNESKEKDIHRRAEIVTAMDKEKGRCTAEEQSGYEREIFEIRVSIENECSNKGNTEKSGNGFSCSLCGGSYEDCICDIMQAPKYHSLSVRSKAKVKDKATAFYRACPGKRSFVTLTFIDAIRDKAAVSILNTFLTQLKKKYKNLQYLWVAERQEKNAKFPGNIHFHLIVNKRLPVSVYNPLWVLEQYNAGLRGHTKYGELITMEEIKKRYKEKTVGKVLNPFDIKPVRSINNLSWYLTKYISKNNSGENGQGFRCAAWHCSRGVSRLFTATVVSPSCFAQACTAKNFSVNKNTGECFYPKVIKKQYWLMVYIHNKRFPLEYLAELEQLNKWLLSGEFEFHSWRDMPVVDEEQYRKYFICKN